jgi:hypothetical protein
LSAYIFYAGGIVDYGFFTCFEGKKPTYGLRERKMGIKTHMPLNLVSLRERMKRGEPQETRTPPI